MCLRQNQPISVQDVVQLRIFSRPNSAKRSVELREAFRFPRRQARGVPRSASPGMAHFSGRLVEGAGQ